MRSKFAAFLLFFLVAPCALPVSSTVAQEKPQQVEWLMVQEAGSGSMLPDGKGGYILTLKDISPYTIFFANRPATQAGSIPTEQFLDVFPWPADAPPNAAVVVQLAPADRDTIIVQLQKPMLNAVEKTLTYRVRIIPGYDGKELAYHKGRADASIPETFGPVSLYIDDLGLSCPSNKSFDCCPMHKCGCICGNPLNAVYSCGKITADSCWYWKPPYGPGCGPCDIKGAFERCNGQYGSCCQPSQGGVCWVGCTRMPNPPIP